MGAGVGGGVVAAGGELGAGGAVVGASVEGATVLVRSETFGDADALALGEAELDDGATPTVRPRKKTAMTRIVSNPPATAARARSI